MYLFFFFGFFGFFGVEWAATLAVEEVKGELCCKLGYLDKSPNDASILENSSFSIVDTADAEELRFRESKRVASLCWLYGPCLSSVQLTGPVLAVIESRARASGVEFNSESIARAFLRAISAVWSSFSSGVLSG